MTVLDCDMVPPASSLNATFAPLLPSLVPAPLASGMLAATVWNQSSLVSKTLHWKRASCPRAGKGGRCGSVAEEAACVAALSDDVRQGESWGLLYFSSNFTGSYLSWYPRSGITPLYQQPVAQYVYARGRDYSTYTYLGAIILSNLMPGLSRSVTTALASNPQIMSLLSPVFLATGISVQGVDLAPVRNFGQHFASYIFCVLMWLGSSFVVVSSYQFKLPAESALLDPRTKRQGQSISPAAKPSDGSGGGESAAPASNGITVRWSELAWELLIKALIASLLMFVLMVLLCAVLWALGGGNEQWYYNPGYAIAFGWYMSWSFIYINAVLLHVIGIERFSSMTALLLILQLTSASGILSVELSNRFFYIGKGLPFFYGVRGFRTIFFGTMEDKMWINWLVFTAYNVVFAPLSLALVSHRLWTAPSRARKAGVGEVAMPIVIGFA
ncbi:hypothetical protein PLESTF_001317800 [Pleodorina starrii]|nr:hypothetical protein PLESTF_001317800 [Pleodorina starrii]